MNTRNMDIDVLAPPSSSQNNKYIRLAGAKVLPPLASFATCELLVNEAGAAMVVFNKQLEEGIHWVEYDVDLSILTFVTWSGNIMELGMKVHAPFRKYLTQGTEVMMVQMSHDGKDLIIMYPAELVVRHIGI